MPNDSPALQEVVRALGARTEHTPESLAAALAHPLRLDDVAPFIRFSPDNYVRSPVTRGPGWELRLLCWQPGQSSSLHGHGPAACAFKILRGSATEAVLGSRDRRWAPGDLVAETRPGLVHQVSNTDTDALVTLHAYSPALPIDAPSPRAGHQVVIVGGGFSGIATAIHLLRHGGPDLRITLVERGPWLGRGIAYGVDSEVFRLNVPASKMSLDPEQRDDFVRWAHAEATPDAFLPRTRYGEYVVERFAEAIRTCRGKVRLVRDQAVALDDSSVTLAGGERLPAAAVVLAMGLDAATAPAALPSDPRIVNAWDECALAGLPRTGRILLLGSALTALDVIAFLHAHRFSGHLTLVSRRGLLPGPHTTPSALPPLTEVALAEAPRELRGLLRWGRDLVADAQRRGAPWQHGIDLLRPHVTRLWRGLPPADRGRFVRAVRPYWDVLRHRAPADLHDLIAAWQREGRLERVAGAIAACVPSADGLAVTLRLPGGAVRTGQYDAIVSCIGPALERGDADGVLARQVVDQGYAAADPAGLGIVTDELGRVITPAGAPSPRLFAIGALRRASSWETTSVPDIAPHALAIARAIAQR